MDNELRKKRFRQILIPILIAVGIMYLFKSGYRTGHWLYEILHK